MTGQGLLADATAAFREVAAALEAERAALEARSADALFATTDRKLAAFARAAELTRGQDLRGLPGAAALASLVERCRRLQDGNAALIRGQRRRVDALLTALTGAPAGRDTYGPDGGASGSRRGRGALASA
jgi:flagellar biosynthesis/type III secretory pathway chaperone